jgi:putative membrane protein
MHNEWMAGDWWRHMGPFMGIFMLIFWGLVIYAVIRFVRATRQNNQETPVSQNRETSLDILNKRYANGEIDQKEYLRIKKDLE